MKKKRPWRKENKKENAPGGEFYDWKENKLFRVNVVVVGMERVYNKKSSERPLSPYLDRKWVFLAVNLNPNDVIN